MGESGRKVRGACAHTLHSRLHVDDELMMGLGGRMLEVALFIAYMYIV